MCLKIVSGSREFPGSQIADMLQFISVSRGTLSAELNFGQDNRVLGFRITNDEP